MGIKSERLGPPPIVERCVMSESPATPGQVRLDDWGGTQWARFGGLPPFDQATPAAIYAAVQDAIAAKRREIQEIVGNPRPPNFENTLVALEDSGRALKRVQAIASVFGATMLLGEMADVAQKIAPLFSDLEDEIAHDVRLFERVDAVWRDGLSTGLGEVEHRLVQVIRERMLRQGAGLSALAKDSLRDINSRLATLSAKYSQNLVEEQGLQAIFIESEGRLDGLEEAQRSAMAIAAMQRGRPGQWAVACERPAVWAFLTHATDRGLREKVWRMWANRGDNAGAFDNTPILSEILMLRGEKARLLGYPSYAHLMAADRMAGTPETALQQLLSTWRFVLSETRQYISALQEIARTEDQNLQLAPWDRLYYADKLRRERFGFDFNAVRPFLQLDSVLNAMFWCADRLHGLVFTELTGVPTVHPSVRVFEVTRERHPVGVLYFDLFSRPGKAHGSYQHEYRTAEKFKGKVIPISSINSSLPAAAPGEPVLLAWEYANVFFHEFGHALHMLCNASEYPTLGSMGVAWDFVELPALINERWLLNHEVLKRFARHYESGDPMPDSLIQALERAIKFDRIFALNLDYLAPAIVDLKLHMRATGDCAGVLDACAIERETLAELEMPSAWDQIMRVTHNVHCFAGGYAAGLYSYLWAEVMAADAAEFFVESPGGFFDRELAKHWMHTILSVGSQVPADRAYFNFRGRGPDPLALLRRFGLLSHESPPGLVEG